MPEKQPTKLDPYYLDPTFERAVVTLCASRARFWGRIGHAIDPECLNVDAAKLALRACRQIALDTHHGPESPMIVLQRLRRWMDEGKTPLDQIKAVALLFDDAFDVGLPSEDAAVAELKPILARRLKSRVMEESIEEYGRDGNFSNVLKLVDKANRLGDTNTSVGVLLGSGSYEEIETIKHLERLPTGIWELDTQLLDGGMRRGSLGVVLGASNDGKSMVLSHIASYGIQAGLFVVYATLELSRADTMARVKANLTGVSINAILEQPRFVEPMISKMRLGPLIVQEFTPQATTMPDLEEWVAACEASVGRQVDLLVTDYGDKLAAPKSAGKEGEHGYSAGRVIFERMRIYANERPAGKIWHWTAAQATRQDKAKKKMSSKLGIDDVSDSMHKVRVADLVVSINPGEAGIVWHVAKNRHGKSKGSVGPIPHDFECGRVSPVMVPEGP